MSTLGTIHSNMTGVEYAPAQPKSGHQLSLEREPQNRCDNNAIKVINGSENFGYLNRQDPLWLDTLGGSPSARDYLTKMASRENCT